MATVELTGFVMTNTIALGQFLVIKITTIEGCGQSSDILTLHRPRLDS